MQPAEPRQTYRGHRGVKFLVDAQLPARLALRLRELGHDAVLTLELPRRNQTSVPEINELSIQEQRVVITKDSDFVDSSETR